MIADVEKHYSAWNHTYSGQRWIGFDFQKLLYAIASRQQPTGRRTGLGLDAYRSLDVWRLLNSTEFSLIIEINLNAVGQGDGN